MAKKIKTADEAESYTKEQLLLSAVFNNRKDALGALIKDGERITIEEAEKRLDEFMKGKVN